MEQRGQPNACSATSSLARALDPRVIAEGVETAAQRSLGCDMGQSYYFGRPMAAMSATEILETVLSRR